MAILVTKQGGCVQVLALILVVVVVDANADADADAETGPSAEVRDITI